MEIDEGLRGGEVTGQAVVGGGPDGSARRAQDIPDQVVGQSVLFGELADVVPVCTDGKQTFGRAEPHRAVPVSGNGIDADGAPVGHEGKEGPLAGIRVVAFRPVVRPNPEPIVIVYIQGTYPSVILVDQLGGLDDAVKKAAQLAKLDEYYTYSYPAVKGWWEQLTAEMAGGNYLDEQMTMFLGEYYKTFMLLKTMNRQNAIQARLPFNISVK